MLEAINSSSILLGLVIFVARIADVSAGTMRTINIVQGRTTVAFMLGFVEVSIWLLVITAVINRVTSEPLLGVFYALGFSMGNVVGIKLERSLAMGHMVVRVISRTRGARMTQKVREQGFMVTTFKGQGKTGEVIQLYIVCRRRDMSRLLELITSIDPDAFYITEQAGSVSKLERPMMQPLTGWRSVLKLK